MNAHLEDHEISAVVAGLDVDEEAREHLAMCLSCRNAVRHMEVLIAARREAMVRETPDWEHQRRGIVAQLPTRGAPVVAHPRRWQRPLLALAATVILAIGVGSLSLRHEDPGHSPMNDAQVEQVLAEVDALLDDDSIPGLWPVDPISDTDDLESLFANGTS